MIATAVGDADGSTRATARRAFWVLKKRFPELAQSIMDSLSPSMQAPTYKYISALFCYPFSHLNVMYCTVLL